jgi:putative membrane protein
MATMLMATTLMVHGAWGGGPWFLLFPLLWGAVLVALFLVWRERSDRRSTAGAEGILAERYARGEITADELRQRREELRRTRP